MSEQPYDEQPRSTKKKWVGLLLLLIGLPVAGYYGVAAWKHATTHVATDNAYVQADMAQITPRVEGTVTEVPVHENWWVKPGQVLVQLDTRDAEVRLAEAKALLTRAHESVDQLFAAVAVADDRHRATQSKIQTAQAEIAVAQAEFHQAELDFHRAQQLVTEQIIATRQFDQAKTQYDAARSRLHAKQQELEEAKQNATTGGRETEHARAALGTTLTGERSEHSLVKQAEAAVREAELNLSYCTLVAPMEGMVSRKAIEVGQRVQPGQALMALLPLHKVYIEANYKETQLTHVRVGQPVEIRADVYPDHVYHGIVESLSGGTGAAFSLLPPENATGNWVKVVQRLPIKITLTEPPPPDLPLRVGLSVEAAIDISHRDGPRLTSLLQAQEQKKVGAIGDTHTRTPPDPIMTPTSVARVEP